ncbi:Lrp/AsnC family transcriptional regulator [Streptomyces olivochromogenes]|uniref:Lrp/AsnC family transcriptional regulator n=1 Tax=Streptomyces olivochromogenes TaxID=1963 RepID=UPI001F36D97A|nr:Lrp/AsnC family transcriptional regulator [Streptomyces olivochromogenes]MCF3133681.1 Lrp/AsnC family transcriptional regulator [Streptomyces olivochromogenes]
MESVTLDELDRLLLHALQLDARVPFSRIAAVLGVSDRTVARRFGRLREAGAVRVSGVSRSRAEWFVRLRVRPHGAAALSRALAERLDTAWVTRLSGDTELACLMRTSGALPLTELSRHPHVTDIGAQRLLRSLMDGWWPGRTSALTAQQIAALREPAPQRTAVELTDLDRRLLPALATDGRAAYADLAVRIGWSESAVRRRLDELRRAGHVRFHVEVDPALYGYTAQCLLWLSVAPSQVAAVAAQLAADAETAHVAAITGRHNLLAVLVCRDTNDLYAYVTDRLGALQGVDQIETAPVDSYTKRFAPAQDDR